MRFKKHGMTMIEVMASLAISSIVMAGMMKQFTQLTAVAVNNRIMTAADLQAETVMHLIGFDLRMLGTGVPFHQSDFEIGEAILSDPSVTEPILIATSDNTHIDMRLDEDGDVYVLTENFVPTSSLSFKVATDTSDLDVGDTVYITNAPIAGTEGLQGTIDSINVATNTITLENDYVTSAGATFGTGSILQEVATVTYDSPDDWSGITRSTGASQVLLSPNSQFTLRYLDDNGTEITPPLTHLTLNSESGADLNRIELTVSVRSDEPLRTGPNEGQVYTAVMRQVFSIRNLNLVDF